MGGEGLHKWFSRNGGKGWIDCHASRKVGLYAFVLFLGVGLIRCAGQGKLKPCGRRSAKGGSKRGYPACRPTLSQCNGAGKRKRSSARVSWKGKGKGKGKGGAKR